jgi:hypothetical protein
VTTDRPYTDADLRHEAARQLAALAEDPDFVGIGEQMVDSEIPSKLPPAEADGAEGMHWDDLPADDFDAAQRAIDDLICGAADLSEWAVNLGADGLEPVGHVLGMEAGDTPLVRVHLAFHPDMDDAARTQFAMRLGLLMSDN